MHHAGQARVQEAGQDLGGEFHQAGFHPPEIAQGLGHLAANGPGADDHRPAHFAFGDHFPHRHGGREAGDVHHPRQVGAGHRETPGPAAGGQDQIVVRQTLLPARFQVFDQNLLVLAVNGQGPGPGPDPHVLGVFEKLRGAEHVKAGAQQLLDVAQVPGNIVRDAAAAVRDIFALVQHGHLEIRAQALEAAGHFGAQGHGPDDENSL